MEINTGTILLLLTLIIGTGGVSSLINSWSTRKHERDLKIWEGRRVAYSKILPKILSLYTEERKLGEKNEIEIDKICGELYLLASKNVYSMVKRFNELIELEEKQFTNFLLKKTSRKWSKISKEIIELKEEIKKEMRKDLFSKKKIKSFRMY